MRNIDVVMATYNGEPYIEEQLQSIVDCEGFDEHINRIIISDDGSSDKTLDLIERLNINCLQTHSNQGPHGVIGNFNYAASQSNADYIIFSDQDDVWYQNKIKVLYDGIVNIETSKGAPCLFFTNLEVVDNQLTTLDHSFWNFQNLDPRVIDTLGGIAMQNISPGCAMIVNRALLRLAFPCPLDVVMHDWWLLLNAKVYGKLNYSNAVTIKYRQHSKNSVGALKLGGLAHLKRSISKESRTFGKIINQFSYLKKDLPCTHPDKTLIEVLSKIKTLNILKRLHLFMTIKSPYLSPERTRALFFRLMLMK